MPCYCSSQSLPMSSLMPTASLSVSAVPPQMPNMIAMLGLGAAEAAPAAAASRIDLRMSALLTPMLGQSWLPSVMPPLISMTAMMAPLAAMFPMDDLNALIAELKQSLASLTEHFQPILSSVARLPKLPMLNMVMAARMTLSLRARGLCPMALSGLDHSFATRMGFAPAMPTSTQ